MCYRYRKCQSHPNLTYVVTIPLRANPTVHVPTGLASAGKDDNDWLSRSRCTAVIEALNGNCVHGSTDIPARVREEKRGSL